MDHYSIQCIVSSNVTSFVMSMLADELIINFYDHLVLFSSGKYITLTMPTIT